MQSALCWSSIKAIDTIPHEHLLGKLDHYGIRGKIHEWIRSFLCSRQMWVAVDDEITKMQG